MIGCSRSEIGEGWRTIGDTTTELIQRTGSVLTIVDIDPDTPVHRLNRLRVAILNMLINAAESLEGKAGLITLKTGEVELTESGDEHLTIIHKIPSRHYVYLELADTGCGFDEQTRQKIFDPFYTTKLF